MDYKIKEETLTGIADAIRSKTGKTEEILAADFAGNINSIDTSKPEETKEVLLDFSGGDMEVVPTTGNVLSKVTIPQPENLLPENIAEGVDIAGIIGTLAASGGSAKIATGTISGNQTSTYTITHNLGVTPDVVFVNCSTSGNSIINNAFGCSTAFADLIGVTAFSIAICTNSSGTKSLNNYNVGIDKTSFGPYLRTANETSFIVVAGSTDKLQDGSTWIAIGGLT